MQRYIRLVYLKPLTFIITWGISGTITYFNHFVNYFFKDIHSTNIFLKLKLINDEKFTSFDY